MATSQYFDMVIVGGGPAGLEAALVAARCMMRTLICCDGNPRSEPAELDPASPFTSNSFLSRDGIRPAELLKAGLADLEKYEHVTVRNVRVEAAKRIAEDEESAEQFEVQAGGVVRSRWLVLATGCEELLEDVFRPLWGRGIYHCPICKGAEFCGKRFLVVMQDARHQKYALTTSFTTPDNILITTHGSPDAPQAWLDMMSGRGARVVTDKIVRIERTGEGSGTPPEMRVTFESGAEEVVDVVYHLPKDKPRHELALELGAQLGADGKVMKDAFGRVEGVPNLTIIGDVSGSMPQVVFAVETAMKGVLGRFIDCMFMKQISYNPYQPK